MNLKKSILTFIIGVVLSFITGAVFNDGLIAITTAICYVSAIVVGIYYGIKY